MYLLISLLIILYVGFVESLLLSFYLFVLLLRGFNPDVYFELQYNPLFCFMFNIFGLIFIPFCFFIYVGFYIINFFKVAVSFISFYCCFSIPNKLYYSTGSGGGDKYPPLDVKYVYN